jgi:uncharacterized small protein (DUF1192 family)
MLDNPRHEEFAKLVAKGIKVGEAYRLLYPNATHKTGHECGSKLSRKSNVRTRVAEIRAENDRIAAEIATKATTKAAHKAAEKICCELLSGNERRSLMALVARDATIDPNVRLRAAMNDAALAGELIERNDLTSNGEALPAALPPITIQPPAVFAIRRGGKVNANQEN